MNYIGLGTKEDTVVRCMPLTPFLRKEQNLPGTKGTKTPEDKYCEMSVQKKG